MAMMSKGKDSPEAKPLLSDFGASPETTTQAIKTKKGTLVWATFEHCRDHVIMWFNLELTSPFLTEAGILPDSFRNRFLKIENTPEQLDTLMNVLCRCSEEQFGKVISILRGTAFQAGPAHEDLVQDLEETFNRLKSEGYTYEANAVTIIIDEINPVSVQYVRRRAPEENRMKKLCDILKAKRRDQKCQAHCAYHIFICTVFLVLLPFFIVFFSLYPPTYSGEVGPSLVAGSNLITVQFGTNYHYLHWIWKFVMSFENCSGQVYAFRNTNCNILNEALTRTPPLDSEGRTWYGFTPNLFLSGSNLSFTNLNSDISDFVVLKSLAAFSDYTTLCKNLGDVNERGACLRTATNSHLCRHEDQLLYSHKDQPQHSLIKNATFWCYNLSDGEQVSFPVDQSDFYIVAVSSGKGHPIINGTVYTYNSSKISSLVSDSGESVDVYEYGNYSSLSIPMSSKAPFGYQESCLLLNATCNGDCSSSCPINGITYALHRGFMAHVVSTLLLVLVLFLLLMVWHLSCKYCRRDTSSQSSINR